MSKTTDNGATKDEMESSLSKASELMTAYYISEFELENPEMAEKCETIAVPLIKSKYNFTPFYWHLAQLFDCKSFMNFYTIFFFGFKADTEMCAYFYNVIVRTCLMEKDLYLLSYNHGSGKKLHGRTIATSFVRGFLSGVNSKLTELYIKRNEEAKQQESQSMGLMLTKKKEKVESEYEEFSKEFKNLKPKKTQSSFIASAYNSGLQKGESINLNKSVKSEGEKQLMLNK